MEKISAGSTTAEEDGDETGSVHLRFISLL
jgi:hypothetical protein